MEKARILEVDAKGRLHLPKKLRERLGIRRKVSARMAGGTLVIESTSNLFEKLGKQVRFRFDSVEEILPVLRGAAEEQVRREIA